MNQRAVHRARRRLSRRPFAWATALVLAGAAAVAVAAAAEIPRAAPEALGFSSVRLARLERFLGEEIAQKHKSGAVVLIARHGRIAWLRAYGEADVERHTPMRTDAMFRLMSMTKPVTSVALLTLYEQGRFQLGDALARYLPEFHDVRVWNGNDASGQMILKPPQRAPSVHDLLRHTAGFAYGGYFEDNPVDRAYQAAGLRYEQLDSVAQLTARLASMPLLYEPGERWVYSFAHDVQAHLVERLSGESFAEYCRRTIFDPLGMKDTVFGIPDALAARYPREYVADDAGGIRAVPTTQDPYRHMTGRAFGGVGLASTARDYLRFAQMLLNGGELNGVRILGRKTVDLMTSDNLPHGTEYWAPGVRYGLGVSVLTEPAQAGNLGSAGQFGWPGLESTWFVVDPHEQLIALLLTQFSPRDVHFDDEFQTLVYQALVR